VIVLALEDRHRLGNGSSRLVAPALRVAGAQVYQEPHERGMGSDLRLLYVLGESDRLVECRFRFVEATDLAQGLAVLG
jgi:hypothetical protein